MFTESGTRSSRESVLVSRTLAFLLTSLTHLLLSALAGAFAASAGAWANADPTTALVLESGLLGGALFALIPVAVSFVDSVITSQSELYANHKDSESGGTSLMVLWTTVAKALKPAAKPLTALVTASLILRFSEEAWDHWWALMLAALMASGCTVADVDWMGLSEERRGVPAHEAQMIGWMGLAGVVVVRVARMSGFYMCRTKAGLVAGLVYGAVMWTQFLPVWILDKVQKARWKTMDQRGRLDGRMRNEYNDKNA